MAEGPWSRCRATNSSCDQVEFGAPALLLDVISLAHMMNGSRTSSHGLMRVRAWCAQVNAAALAWPRRQDVVGMRLSVRAASRFVRHRMRVGMAAISAGSLGV